MEKVSGELKNTFDPRIEKGVFKDGALHGSHCERVTLNHDNSPREWIVGDFQNGKLHGQGYIKAFDFRGSFKDGKPTSSADIIDPNKDKNWTLGEFQNGELHGKGKIVDFTGRKTEGQFLNGKLNGQGKITDGSAEQDEYSFIFSGKNIFGVEKEGIFKDGLLIQGTNKYKRGCSQTKYSPESIGDTVVEKGNFCGESLHGEGIKIIHHAKDNEYTSTVYEGTFNNGSIWTGYMIRKWMAGESPQYERTEKIRFQNGLNKDDFRYD